MFNDDFESMLEESFTPEAHVTSGKKIEATVVSKGSEYIFLDLGTREEGLLPVVELTEMQNPPELNEGDRITVLVTGKREGALMCALRIGGAGTKAKGDDKEEVIASLKEAYDAGMPVEGTVKESIKGGFNVTLMGVRAFCPISQIDNKFCETPEEHVGRTYVFEIIKFEESGRNLVLSRRKLLDRDAQEKADTLWATLEEGKTYGGTVASLQKYGAFVDIGGVEGLLHVSEISHARIADPSEELEVGQRLTVAIKELNPQDRKISLSLKALQEDPWDTAVTSLSSGQVLTGRVVRLANFGAFVAVVEGIEGLLHISELSKEKRIHNPREVLETGQEVQVRILNIDPESRRISLTMNTEDDEENWQDELAAGGGQKDSGFGTFADLLKGKTPRKR